MTGLTKRIHVRSEGSKGEGEIVKMDENSERGFVVLESEYLRGGYALK